MSTFAMVELPTNPQLVERFVRELSRHEPQIYAFIRSLVPNRADAEDVLQETHVTLWRKIAEFDGVTNFLAWSYAIARIEVLRHRGKQRPEKVLIDDAFLETVSKMMVERAELLEARREALFDCVGKLSARDRDLINRRYEEGKTTQTVAGEVGRSVDAVYKALARIRHAIFLCVERTLAREGLL